MAEGDERVRVLYSGTVQGVGFRWRASRCASGLGLRGFVRNLPDGTVELVAEGPRAQVESLLAAVREAMGDLIDDEAAAWTPARGGLGSFGIAR